MKTFFTFIIFVSLFLINTGTYSAPKHTSGVQQNTDSSGISDTLKKNTTTQGTQNTLPIDTAATEKIETYIQDDTVTKIDSVVTEAEDENTLTNTKLFVYILLSVLGLGLFFFIFVINLFKTFHKKKSTRQSLLLSWNLFFIVSIIWIFIVWGIVAAFWTYPSFMIVMIFLFIISLIMTIIAVKSK
ncbi:MAG: hypothetical protein WAT71_14400 [Ignavibacteria bacterium]